MERFYKDTFAWPILAGLIVFSVKGPDPLVIASVFILSIYIFVNSTGKEKITSCGVFFFYQIANALFIVYAQENPNSPLFKLPNLWIANRILYVIGFGLFIPPILNIFKNSKRKKDIAIFSCFTLLFAAYAVNLHDRSEKVKKYIDCEKVFENTCLPKNNPDVWYSIINLLDDTLIGFSAAALIIGLSDTKNAKKYNYKMISCHCKKLHPRKLHQHKIT